MLATSDFSYLAGIFKVGCPCFQYRIAVLGHFYMVCTGMARFKDFSQIRVHSDRHLHKCPPLHGQHRSGLLRSQCIHVTFLYLEEHNGHRQ